MRCQHVRKYLSSYIDGELDDVRSSAVRGHVRVCDGCAELLEDFASMTEAAATVDPIQPPAQLWSNIQSRLAEEEIGDAQHSPLWLWWKNARRLIRTHALSGAVVATAIALLVVWATRGSGTADEPAVADDSVESPSPADTVEPAPTPVAVDPATFLDSRTAELRDTDETYRMVIEELRGMVEEERPTWTAEARDAFDARLIDFDDAIKRHRQRLGVGTAQPAPSAYDALFAVYQAQIELLQRAAVGDLVAEVTR
jgi:hypothetical protein